MPSHHRRSPIDRWSERIDDRARDKRGRWLLFADLCQDVRYAGRRLVAQPGFTTVAALTLALGIGANTAIFSIIDALLLESLPLERPRELVLLTPTGIRIGWTTGDHTWPYQAYLGLRQRQQVFSGLIAERTDAVNLTIDGAAQRAIASIVSGNYFDVLGLRPLMGRLLSDADDRIRSGHPVVVLSYGFWVERLGMQPDIVGRDVRIGGRVHALLGRGRYVESQLYGIPSGDLATLGGAAGVLMAVAIVSGWLPARRASRVDPMLALRHE